eukprot:Gb_23670 [translate_table: standard]
MNSKGTSDSEKLYCIYVTIGETLNRATIGLNYFGADDLEYSIIIAATTLDLAPSQFLAPYSGCAIGEYFCDNRIHTLIIYDDLSK